MSVTYIIGDSATQLSRLPEGGVYCCVTSPPYWGLRSYLDAGDPNKAAELGAEPTPEAYVANMVAVFREVRRVLRDDGVLWLNLGDCYAGKNLVGIPWRVAFALQADGWYLRAAIPWIKRNVLPSSVRDRPTTAHETIFLLAKSERYFYDLEAVKIESAWNRRNNPAWNAKRKERNAKKGGGNRNAADGGMTAWQPEAGRQRRDSDWFFDSLRAILDGGEGLLHNEEGDPIALVVNPRPYKGAHYAVFPPQIVEPLVKAGSPEKCCSACGRGWRRAPEGLRPDCTCEASPVPSITLDPFGGSGTTAAVSVALGRKSIWIDLDSRNVELARERIPSQSNLFARGG